MHHQACMARFQGLSTSSTAVQVLLSSSNRRCQGVLEAPADGWQHSLHCCPAHASTTLKAALPMLTMRLQTCHSQS